jgi:hypothetical protein
MEEKTMSDNYDVVLHTLGEKRNRLLRITERNMNSEYVGMNIMDDIRLSQIRQLDIAIRMWKERLDNINKPDAQYSDIISDGGMDPR